MKTILTLYIDSDIKELAKSKNINISKTFQEFMSIELELLKKKKTISKEDEIKLLKQKLALTLEELNKKSKELTSLKNKEKEDKWEILPNGMKVRK
jgi:hypothetical protein